MTSPIAEIQEAEATSETLRPPSQPGLTDSRTLLRILAAVSFCHLINDMIQSLLAFHLSNS